MYSLLVPISCGRCPVENNIISCGGHILWMISCGEHRYPVENADILWRSLVYPVENISCGCYPVENNMISCGEHILWGISCGEHMVILWRTLFSTGYTHSRSPQEILNVYTIGTHILWVLSCGEHSDILWRTYPVDDILWRTYGYTVENIVIFCSPHGTHILWVLSCGEQHDVLWRTYPVGIILLWRT